MSFFKNITDKFDNLGIGDSKRDEAAQGTREYGYHGPGDNPPPAQYVAAPPPPAYQPPSDKPPIPSGWIPLFDQGNQRWYYVEEATGRSQWEAPGYTAPPSGSGDDSRTGFGAPGGPPPGYAGGGGGGAGYEQPSQEKKGSGKGGMLLGAAGGLAAGAVGGALLHHALSDSDSDKEGEQRHAYQQPAPYQPPQPEYYPQASYAAAAPPTVLPPTDADGSSVSSSDREDVQEARERYEEALADAADSDASSSEEEELEEARDEYYEEYEDTYGGDDDDY
ncbi:hypothetical protein JDV02_000362 [Purpureocillium takamizusanense]|uniref:WW domain-containing protein n=1 Tax=Purpureocillium takamizusanense TaxID=2060973 RepID=A0A9Q8V6B6_9HYPO|nr:uncharacterized protein JDV02_000362 [Purpureocillium takamizusanense]UNI13637.1 hypothetical protein JDV02_000362 [Purpureocillium takamizusanense]